MQKEIVPRPCAQPWRSTSSTWLTCHQSNNNTRVRFAASKGIEQETSTNTRLSNLTQHEVDRIRDELLGLDACQQSAQVALNHALCAHERMQEEDHQRDRVEQWVQRIDVVSNLELVVAGVQLELLLQRRGQIVQPLRLVDHCKDPPDEWIRAPLRHAQ